MTAAFAARLAACLLAADGITALALAGILGPVIAWAIGAVVPLSLVGGPLRERLGASRGLTGTLAVLTAAASFVDLVYLAETALDGFVHLLVFLVVARLFTLTSPRDARVVAFLVFFMLVAAASASFGLGFLFVFLAYLLLTTWLLLLQHVLTEAEAGPGRVVVGEAQPLGNARGLLILAVAASVATMAVTAVLFFVIPRVGLAALPFRGRMGPLVTGFSERVELGSYGQIQTDETVAMRVHVPEGTPAPETIPDLRWRGIVFDTFDGRAWTVGEPERLTFRRVGPGPGDFRLAIPRAPGRVLHHEVYLEPIGTDVIFAAARVTRLTLRSELLTVDDMGSLSVASPSARLHYVVESELGDGPLVFPVRPRARPPSADPAFRRYLGLPPLAPRVGALAREVAGDAGTPYAAAVKLTEHLAREYRYTLALERQTQLDPVEEFLFVRRSGNCEYFAAALAVMLRTLGIPSRVVGGFQRGEWNPYGRYFTVRMRDAHSWVEAYIHGAGWIMLDPSPRAEVETASLPGQWSLYLDALRMRWYRYVINWSLRDQVEMAATVRRQTTQWRLSFGPLPGWRDVPRWTPVAAVALALVVTGALAWRRRTLHPATAATRRPPRFYAQALSSLARRGLTPSPAETAREFATRVSSSMPACGPPFATLTTTYERARFGPESPTAADLATAEFELTRLTRVLATRNR
jgi:transglutaminase-like putative cysteine protease